MHRFFRLFAIGLTTLIVVTACNAGGQHGVVPQTQPFATHRSHVGMHVSIKASAPSKRRIKAMATSTNALGDPGFESGGFSTWQQCGNAAAVIDSSNPHSGSYDALIGNTSANPGEEYGLDGVCQTVMVPASGQLSVWVNESTSETSTSSGDQEADIMDANGNITQTLYAENGNTNGYVQKSFDLSSLAGTSVTLFFGIYGSGSATDYNDVYVDDVSLAAPSGGTTPTPTPTGTPLATPTPGSGAPTPFPTPAGSGPQGQSCGSSCGVQRWHIKTLDDNDESLINWNPVLANVSDLTSIPVPASYDQYNDTTRYAPAETQAYRVRAVLVGWKTESDHDYHLVIADVNNPSNTMIVEPPDSTCSDACDSGFGSIFAAVRAKLASCFGQPTSTFTNFPSGVVVDMTGVPLFDALHGQTGVAPNGIELHPLLDVQFVSGQPSGC